MRRPHCQFPFCTISQGKIGAFVRQLRIGIDGYNFAMPKGTGIATYGLNLARTLATGKHQVEGVFGIQVGQDLHLREAMFFDNVGQIQTSRVVFGSRLRRHIHMAWATIKPQIRAEPLEIPLTNYVDKEGFVDKLPIFSRLNSTPGLFPLAQRHFSVTGQFLLLRMKNPPDIMHWTYPVPVKIDGAPNIYTIHDLVPLRLPYTTLTNKPHFDRLLRACVAQGDHICTVSEFSRKDIINQLGVKHSKITNTYQNSYLPKEIISESFDESARKIDGMFGLAPRSFFLFFGAVEPKKNLARLLEAFLGLKLSTPLVLVGGRAWLSEGELSLLPPEDPRIIRLDYLPRNILLRLIRVSRAVLFPSIFEGFGLPVLEAMQLGTPVLTSDRSSLPEVAGKAALLVDPYDASAISEGIRQLDDGEDLRARLGTLGLSQAATFGEAIYLNRLEAMYAEVLRRSST